MAGKIMGGYKVTPVVDYPGIYRMTLPLAGKQSGPVNVYLFKGRYNNTLLDCGPLFSTGKLNEGLSQLGLGLKDIDRVVLTHGHVDHYGGVRGLQKKNKIPVCVYAHKEDIQAIERGADASSGAYNYFLTLTGTPAAVRWPLTMLFRAFQFFSKGCLVNRRVDEGDLLAMGDYEMRVIATPGHTRGAVCLFCEKEQILFSGDHILERVVPNARVMLEENNTLPTRLSQKEYYRSLKSIAMLNPKLIFPGHGRVIHDFAAVRRACKENFFQRRQTIFAIIKADPHKTVYQIARELFYNVKPKYSIRDISLAVSEIFTHIQVLETDGYVRMQVKDNLVRLEQDRSRLKQLVN